MGAQMRKQIRLKDYDYSENGVYFVTICTKDRRPILWNVGADIIRQTDCVRLSDCGMAVDAAIRNITAHYLDVAVDKYVIMNNHVHIMLSIEKNERRIISAPACQKSQSFGFLLLK